MVNGWLLKKIKHFIYYILMGVDTLIQTGTLNKWNILNSPEQLSLHRI